MANRIRSFVESIVFAGMKPAARPSGDGPAAKSGLLDRLFSAENSSDPLYLSNQTLGQKLRRLVLTAIPLVVIVAVAVAGIGIYESHHPKAVDQPTNAEISARSLPAFNHKIVLDTNKDVEVVEVHFEREGHLMVGSFKNVSNHALAQAVLVFDLADTNRSQLGNATVTQDNIPAGATRNFQLQVEQTTAAFATVREVQTK